MNRLFFSTILACSIVLPLVLCGGCDETQEIVMTPEGTFTVSFLEGQEAGRHYAEEGLPAYVLVWRLYEVRTNLRGEFLDGFEAGLAKAGATASATAYRVVLQDAMSGNQFETARDLGAKHAAQAVTNEQIQGTIHSSLGVSQGVALGWKAGYIKGFASRRIADTAAAASVNESRMSELQTEAAATYHALRAAIGP